MRPAFLGRIHAGTGGGTNRWGRETHMNSQIPMTLKAGLVIGLVVCAVYGLILFLIPAQFVAFAGGEPVSAGWLRWPGGMLIAAAVCTYLVLQSPKGQGVMVVFAILSFLLAGLAMLFSWLTGEYTVDTVQIAFPAILNLVVSGLIYLGWSSTRDLLKWK